MEVRANGHLHSVIQFVVQACPGIQAKYQSKADTKGKRKGRRAGGTLEALAEYSPPVQGEV